MVLLVTGAMGHVGFEVAKLAAAAGIAAYAAWMRTQPEIHR